ncbi:MAG: XRE family transcriptional regulator [Terracidiphilus sp.]
MAHKWRDIRRTLSAEREDETRRYVRSVVDTATLNQLREARNLTQANLATVLGVNQGSVSKMEKRTDMYVSTLRGFIQAMGGQLQIKAVFPDGEIEIDQFKNVAGSAAIPENTANENSDALVSKQRLAS